MKKNIIRVIAYGFVLYIILNIVLFILSIIFRFDTEINKTAGLCLAIIMAIITRLFLSQYKIRNIKEAFFYTTGWTVVVFVLLLIITLANGTTKVLFGNWIAYVVIVAMVGLPIIKLKYEKNERK